MRSVPAIRTEVIPGARHLVHLVHLDAPNAFVAAVPRVTDRPLDQGAE
ncbi:hypothetical protein [Streptomyces sporangiiformans]|nr:hypothetical protein [Streptomyces sporangiiformans]